jgi:hypothetical protein
MDNEDIKTSIDTLNELKSEYDINSDAHADISQTIYYLKNKSD